MVRPPAIVDRLSMTTPRSRAELTTLTVDRPNGELCQIWKEHVSAIGASNECFNCVYFETTTTQRRLWSKIEAKFRSVSPAVEFRGGMGEMCGWPLFLL